MLLESYIPAKPFPTSGIEDMALKKKKTDEPKYATKNKRIRYSNKRTRYSKNGAPFRTNDSPARK